MAEFTKVIAGQKIVFVDEIWRCCSPSHLPASLANIIQDGRKNGVGLLATTQVPHRMNESMIGESTELVSFRLEGRNKLKFIEDNADEFPVTELAGLLLIEKVSSLRGDEHGGRAVRRYELDHKNGKTAAALAVLLHLSLSLRVWPPPLISRRCG